MPRIALIGVVAALAGATATAALVRRRRRAPESARSPERRTFACTCGTEYRVTGTGRHRVYWPAAAPDDEPVLGDTCPECGATLAAEPAGAAA
jgi:hypothetical protein